MLTEKEKYVGIYNSPSHKFYGHSNHGKAALHLIIGWNPKTLIDVGCGYNEFVLEVRKYGVEAIGVDFACPGADVIADAQSLPFENKKFDTLTAFDMLEHLRPQEVDFVLKEFARISTRFIFSICYGPSVNKWQGETLHPTVMPEKWWVDSIIRAGGTNITKEKTYIIGMWRI